MATLYVTTTDGRISNYPLLKQETTIGKHSHNCRIVFLVWYGQSVPSAVFGS